MMLRALGYTAMPASENWETPVVAKAAEVKLFKDVGAVNGSTFLNRNAVAQVALNALKADVVNTDKEGDIIVEGIVTIPGKITYNKVEDDTSRKEYLNSLIGREVTITIEEKDETGSVNFEITGTVEKVSTKDDKFRVYVEGKWYSMDDITEVGGKDVQDVPPEEDESTGTTPEEDTEEPADKLETLPNLSDYSSVYGYAGLRNPLNHKSHTLFPPILCCGVFPFFTQSAVSLYAASQPAS